MKELREYLAANPDCRYCALEGITETATTVGLVEDDQDPVLSQPVSACRLHADMVLMWPDRE